MSTSRPKTFASSLRSLAGVREDVLARVPGDIPRYTALGGVVLGTAVIATFSMWMLVSQVLGAPSLVAVIPALGWGVFILNLDRWLVCSATGMSLRTRAPVLLPRLAVAVLLGFVIAEPVVLQTFRTAVETRVGADRKAEVVAYESNLLRCNPVPPVALNRLPGDCKDLVLDVGATSARSNAAELARLQKEANGLAAVVANDDKVVAGLENLARLECNGTSGPGLTGVVGEGPNCETLRGQVASYRRDHRITENVAKLAAVRNQILTLSTSVATADRSYEKARHDAISAKVAEKRATFGPIGLLERFEALEKETSGNAFLRFARWFVTLVFIVLDCLPVLVKMMSRPTHYERMAHADATNAESAFTAESAATLRVRTSEIEANAFIGELEIQMWRDERANAIRLRAADARATLDAEIDRLAGNAARRMVAEEEARVAQEARAAEATVPRQQKRAPRKKAMNGIRKASQAAAVELP
jgi:hypothetical protein